MCTRLSVSSAITDGLQCCIWLRVPHCPPTHNEAIYTAVGQKKTSGRYTLATRKMTQFYVDNNTVCFRHGCFVPRPKSKDADAVSKVTAVDRISRLQRLFYRLLVQSDPGQIKACSMMPRSRCP